MSFHSKMDWLLLELCSQKSPLSLKLLLSGDFVIIMRRDLHCDLTWDDEREKGGKKSKMLTSLATVWTLFPTKAAGLKPWFPVYGIWGGSINFKSGLSERQLHEVLALKYIMDSLPFSLLWPPEVRSFSPLLFQPFCSALPLGLK